jgi:hypothetical protein
MTFLGHLRFRATFDATQSKFRCHSEQPSIAFTVGSSAHRMIDAQEREAGHVSHGTNGRAYRSIDQTFGDP